MWPFISPRLDGVEFPIGDPGLKPYFMPCGIHYNGHLSGVLYRAGKITYVPLPYGQGPVISFEFSGCDMAKLCFRGMWYAFHISTSEYACYDCKSQWKAFLSQYKRDISTLVMFKPTMHRDLFEKSDELHRAKWPVTLAGLIAEDNTCYTLVYDYKSARVVTAADACTDYIRPWILPHLCM